MLASKKKHPFASINEFNLLEIIGEGAFGVVYRAAHIISKNEYAIKIIDLSKLAPQEYENVEKELKIHSQLNYKHVVQCYDFMMDDDIVYMVLEYCGNGSLFNYLNSKLLISNETIKRFFYQTILGIKYLHDMDIVLRDLKPENLLLDDDNNVKICDFGWASDVKDARYCSLKSGTAAYMSPESITKQRQEKPTDVWSLGVLLYEMYNKCEPFSGSNTAESLKQMKTCQISFSPGIDPEAKELIKSLLRYTPCNRPTVDDILRERYLQMYTGYRQPLRVNTEMNKEREGSKSNSNYQLHLKPLKVTNDMMYDYMGDSRQRNNSSLSKVSSNKRLLNLNKTLIKPKKRYKKQNSGDLFTNKSINKALKERTARNPLAYIKIPTSLERHEFNYKSPSPMRRLKLPTTNPTSSKLEVKKSGNKISKAIDIHEDIYTALNRLSYNRNEPDRSPLIIRIKEIRLRKGSDATHNMTNRNSVFTQAFAKIFQPDISPNKTKKQALETSRRRDSSLKCSADANKSLTNAHSTPRNPVLYNIFKLTNKCKFTEYYNRNVKQKHHETTEGIESYSIYTKQHELRSIPPIEKSNSRGLRNPSDNKSNAYKRPSVGQYKLNGAARGSSIRDPHLTSFMNVN